jgi:hypothetical protein
MKSNLNLIIPIILFLDIYTSTLRSSGKKPKRTRDGFLYFSTPTTIRIVPILWWMVRNMRSNADYKHISATYYNNHIYCVNAPREVSRVCCRQQFKMSRRQTIFDPEVFFGTLKIRSATLRGDLPPSIFQFWYVSYKS